MPRRPADPPLPAGGWGAVDRTARAGLAPVPFHRLARRHQVRHAANWANLSTAAGLLVARVGGCRVRRGPRGLILADGYRFAFPVAGAFTVGDVVLTRHRWDLSSSGCPLLLGHEERHSLQYAVCLGLPFLPLYAVAMAWSWWRTGDWAARNVFERHAGLAGGGYREIPLRPRREDRHHRPRGGLGDGRPAGEGIGEPTLSRGRPPGGRGVAGGR